MVRNIHQVPTAPNVKTCQPLSKFYVLSNFSNIPEIIPVPKFRYFNNKI